MPVSTVKLAPPIDAKAPVNTVPGLAGNATTPSAANDNNGLGQSLASPENTVVNFQPKLIKNPDTLSADHFTQAVSQQSSSLNTAKAEISAKASDVIQKTEDKLTPLENKVNLSVFKAIKFVGGGFLTGLVNWGLMGLKPFSAFSLAFGQSTAEYFSTAKLMSGQGKWSQRFLKFFSHFPGVQKGVDPKDMTAQQKSTFLPYISALAQGGTGLIVAGYKVWQRRSNKAHALKSIAPENATWAMKTLRSLKDGTIKRLQDRNMYYVWEHGKTLTNWWLRMIEKHSGWYIGAAVLLDTIGGAMEGLAAIHKRQQDQVANANVIQS